MIELRILKIEYTIFIFSLHFYVTMCITYMNHFFFHVIHFYNFYYIENKNKTPWKLLGSEHAQVHVVEVGFQRDRNSAGWGRRTGTVLISILAAVSTPLIWRLSTTEVRF